MVTAGTEGTWGVTTTLEEGLQAFQVAAESFPATLRGALWPDCLKWSRGTPTWLPKLGRIVLPLGFLVCPVGIMTVPTAVGDSVKEGLRARGAKSRTPSTCSRADHWPQVSLWPSFPSSASQGPAVTIIVERTLQKHLPGVRHNLSQLVSQH